MAITLIKPPSIKKNPERGFPIFIELGSPSFYLSSFGTEQI